MVEIRHAATVCIFRESDQEGLEILMLKRNDALKFAPGFWVFPGGRIEPSELQGNNKLIEAAVEAAKREAYEETQLEITVNPEHHYYHWTTPLGETKRFATWFFHTLIDYDMSIVQVDGSEIVNHSWVRINDIFTSGVSSMRQLLPPTYITLQRIKNAVKYQDVIDEFKRSGPIKVVPRVSYVDGQFCSMYPGDSGYETLDSTKKDVLHRLTGHMNEGKYRFHYSEECAVPSITGGIMF